MTTGGIAAIGFDVGGTKILGVAVDADGEILHEERRPTPQGQAAIGSELVAAITALHEAVGAPVGDVPLAVGMPGLITDDGVVVSSPNLPGVTNFDVAAELTTRLGTPVTVANDATCAALAEWQVGAGQGARDLVMVTLGTGIGGGLVSGGVLQTGAHGFAGEYGHMVVDLPGLPCPCGRSGCWERYASGSGLANLARVAAIGGRLPRVVELAGGDPNDVRGEHVHEAANDGDQGALAVVDDFGRWVALGLANLTNALDPDVFVLGGGLAEGADLFIGPVERWFDELLYASDLRPRPGVVFAALGEHAGAIGAALLARRDQ